MFNSENKVKIDSYKKLKEYNNELWNIIENRSFLRFVYYFKWRYKNDENNFVNNII